MGLLAHQELICDTIADTQITSISAPRQNGKTYAAIAAAILLGGRTVFVSRTFAAAKNAMHYAESCINDAKVKETRRSNGEMAILLERPIGNRLVPSGIQFMVYGKGGGRGYVADTLIFDDAEAVSPDFLGEFYPVVFNSDRMRIAAFSLVPDEGLAQAVNKIADVHLYWRSEDVYEANPALGQLIKKEHLDRAKKILPTATYRREVLGLTTCA